MSRLLRPSQQRVASQRNTRGMKSFMPEPQTAQYPIDFSMIARVVCAWQSVELTAATPEMRHRHMPTCRVRCMCTRADVMAARGALQAVEHHPTSLPGVPGPKVHIDEVAIWAVPAFTLPRDGGSSVRPQRRSDGLHMPTMRPQGCAVGPFQCNTCGASPISGASPSVPGLAWCTTMRHPCAVR